MPGPQAGALTGAQAQAQARTLAGEWQHPPQRASFTVVCSHFGEGQAFRATLQAWRDGALRPLRLVFISSALRWPADPPPEGSDWPPPTRNLHLLDFEGGRVRLLLALGLADPWRQLRQVRADAFWLDGADFTDASGDPRRAAFAVKAMARLAAPQARLALWRAAPAQTAALRAAGFIFDTPAGEVSRARFEPRFRSNQRSKLQPPGPPEFQPLSEPLSEPLSGPLLRAFLQPFSQPLSQPFSPPDLHAISQPPAQTPSQDHAQPISRPYSQQLPAPHAPTHVDRAAAMPLRPPPHTLVVGAGIAGACAAAALARRGWCCTVLDAHAQPAGGASGNPAAIFHGTVHAVDGLHARFTRAAALHARRVHAELIARGVPGQLTGLLRAGAAETTPMPPPGWASFWPASQLQASGSGLRTDSAWFFAGGGWIDAAAAVRALLATPGVTFRGQAAAAGLQRRDGQWQVLDTDGQPVATADVVVLAGAGGGDHGAPAMAALLQGAGAAAWPASRTRGQVSWFGHDGPALPWPVAGGGYAISLADPPRLLCGATTQADDEDALARAADHDFNLTRLRALTGLAPGQNAALQGRVAWRERVPDRLPVVGAALDAQALSGLRDAGGISQLRDLPRLPGLFVLGAMAGRGFTWGPLAGEVLASWVDGTAQPLEADLLDGLDPARFWLRQARRPRRP